MRNLFDIIQALVVSREINLLQGDFEPGTYRCINLKVKYYPTGPTGLLAVMNVLIGFLLLSREGHIRLSETSNRRWLSYVEYR